MVFDDQVAQRIAVLLLQAGALRINTERPFRWSGGWLSPVYCDNRRTLSFPEVRTYIKEQLAAAIRSRFPSCEVVAAVATAGIAHGVLVADLLQVPFCYVRPSPKEHGLQQRIEGVLLPGSQVVVVEDLLSTGNSSARVVEVLQAAGAQVIGLAAIFSYEFNQARQALEQRNCPAVVLSSFSFLLMAARASGGISEQQHQALLNWQQDPQQWSDQRSRQGAME
ncbi:MAG: orotate phosphoribosyltransferase [Chitinophagales bacterium]|nr:orotate phosphoribosyltransferase [Chitinophagales bacterium]